MKTRQELEKIAKEMRKDVFKMAYNSGPKGAHIGGSMSCIEILAVLYGDILNYKAEDGMWDDRDRLVMSKAHSAIGLYAALKYAGFITEEELNGAMQGDSIWYKHPMLNPKQGIEFSGGSLGQGLGLIAGTALALRYKNNSVPKCYCILGDGECDEGSVWEAASFIIHYNLDNITIIIDKNCLQNDGKTIDVMNLGDISTRFRAMGYEVLEVNGHDVIELQEAFYKETKLPKVIIANTIKGKGVSFAENNVDWHISYFNKELFEQAMEEL